MNRKSVLWGILLIGLGVVLGLNAMDITNIDLFFDGWWTLFIIVPCLFGLVEEKDKTGNLIGLCVGLAFLAGARGWVDFQLIWRLAFPALLVIMGLGIVLRNLFGDRAARRFIRENRDDPNMPEYCATFSGQDLRFHGQCFRGARLTAVFGSVKCDLTGAMIERDVMIHAEAIFGGVEILVPAQMQVRVVSNSAFGGVSEKRPHSTDPNAITVYVNGMCMFGGVTVK